MSDEETKKVDLYPPNHPEDMPMTHAEWVRRTAEWNVAIHNKTSKHYSDDGIKGLLLPVMKEQIRTYLAERSGKFGQIANAVLVALIQAGALVIAWLALGK